MKPETLWVPPALARACPHLHAFFPDRTLVVGEGQPGLAALDEGGWAAPGFNGVRRPLALVTPGLPVPAARRAAEEPLARSAAEEPLAHRAAEELPACRAAETIAAWQAEFGTSPPHAVLEALPHTRFANPFRAAPCPPAEAVALLALWRRTEALNRNIGAFLGMAGWKRAAIATAFGHGDGHAPFARTPAEALARPGAVLAWASSLAVEDEPRIWRVEDGFIRSIGLGVNFAPASSLAVDDIGIHYDPARVSRLENILTETAFPPALLARAAALRATITARNITKYTLAAAPPALPPTPGRRRVLVVGQVEDDASIRRGAGRVRTNAALLAAARAAEPDAFLIFKPHPDVQTGYRRGYLKTREALRHADMVVTSGNIGTLLAEVDGLHTITSLAGFEALLRGVAVTTWGGPFYAGWGLTEDREPPPRRGRRLALDELVAGCLILYPRYQDPVTKLPCLPETLLDRLAQPELWPPLPPGRRGYVLWWKLQGQLLKFARHTGLWQR